MIIGPYDLEDLVNIEKIRLKEQSTSKRGIEDDIAIFQRARASEGETI